MILDLISKTFIVKETVTEQALNVHRLTETSTRPNEYVVTEANNH